MCSKLETEGNTPTFYLTHPPGKQSYAKYWLKDCFGNLHIYFVFPTNILRSFKKKKRKMNQLKSLYSHLWGKTIS